MLEVLLLIIPFGLAGAVSPIMLTEQTLVLSGKGGRRAGRRYAAGAFLVVVVWVGLLVFFGRAISLPGKPTLDANLDIALGLLLVAGAGVLHRRGRRPPQRPEAPRRFDPRAAFGFGAFSMATNFTTLALVVPGAKAISAGDLLLPERALLVLILAGLAATPAWLPVVLTELAPGPAHRILNGIGEFIRSRGRQVTVLLLAGLGLLLILRGILRMTGF